MTIITTIYAIELETAKKIPAQNSADDKPGTLPKNDREFLGIYQGRNQAEPNEK